MSLFITFEGVEGAGKTTQIQILTQNLRQRGIPVLATREPGGCPLANEIRKLLLSPDQGEMASSAELLLYLAARAQHVFEVIRPALAEGKIVLCDRFADATTVYQGYARGIDLQSIRQFNDFAVSSLTPDLTILMDMAVEKGQDRLVQRNNKTGSRVDRLEMESIDFHRRVRQGYLTLSREFPERFHVVDAAATQDEVAIKILKSVEPFLT